MGRAVAAYWTALSVRHVRCAKPYTYAETDYANPHALTGFFNGTAMTTYSYDANGNLATTTGASTSTFMWDSRALGGG